MTISPALEARSVSKRFGGVHALREVSLKIYAGEVHALCGENGAGKSTLLKILTGFYPASSFEGDILTDGRLVEFHSVREAENAGVGIVHQELLLIDSLTAAENVLLGRFPGSRWSIDWPSALTCAHEMFERFGVPVAPETLVADLGVGQQQLVEIARTLSRSPRILLLDEPTAALSPAEVENLLDQVCRLRDAGVACVYISHKLDEVMRIADRITVLRDGACAGSFRRAETDLHEIIHRMVGRELSDIYPPLEATPAGKPQLEIEHLSANSCADHHLSLHDISLAVRSGEILGLGGLLGAGRSELLMHLYGMWGQCTGGRVRLATQPYDQRSPRRSLARGLMLITEDRKRYGLIPHQSTHRNLSLSSLSKVTRRGAILQSEEYHRNCVILEKLRFRSLDSDAAVEQLSGGNQQKVVLARGLLTEPKVVLLDEPTRGVDIGAKQEIYREIGQLAAAGKAVVMASSELPELMGMCHRVAIMRHGRLVKFFDRAAFDAGSMLAAANGVE